MPKPLDKEYRLYMTNLTGVDCSTALSASMAGLKKLERRYKKDAQRSISQDIRTQR